MKVLIIGGKGTIGNKIGSHLAKKHQIVSAGRHSGDVTVDITDSASIQQMFEKTGEIDAIICVAGEAKWSDFDELTEEDYYLGLKSKLMGQVNLVRLGRKYLSPNGSITLTTGILADDPVIKTTSAAMVNGAIHSFVRAVALELENGVRINAVSCGVVEDSYEIYRDYFPGHNPITMDKVVNGYVRSVEGRGSGEIIKLYQ